jgi:hypothetical protein
MENGTIEIDGFTDASWALDDAGAAFEAFLNSETTKPVFRFADA